jgi:ABC-type amino acid transport substrate-binding protein
MPAWVAPSHRRHAAAQAASLSALLLAACLCCAVAADVAPASAPASPPASASATAPASIVYPLDGPGTYRYYDYEWAVLHTAMQKTEARYGPYTLRQNEQPMSPARADQELLLPRGQINIIVRATDAGLEREFLPVRLPVDRGLLGNRVFLVREADLPRFAAVRTLDDLRRLRAGLGYDWADLAIVQAAGIPTVTSHSYEGLFTMLMAGRFDFFSRALDEAAREYDERHARMPQLALEPTLLLRYPLPRYFFLRRDAEGRKLAARIADGLEIMIKDGSLDALFQQYKHELIERNGLTKRRVISIPNPTLSRETPLGRSELWYDPQRGK